MSTAREHVDRVIQGDMPTKRQQGLATVQAYRTRARRGLPRFVFDFIDGASGDERTARQNRDALLRQHLTPRVNTSDQPPTTAVSILGRTIELPVIIAPTGMAGLVRPDGEMLLAQAAHRAGTIVMVSPNSSCAFDEVCHIVPPERCVFQVFPYADRRVTDYFIQRIEATGCTAICVALDCTVSGRHTRDMTNGLALPRHVRLSSLAEVALHPRWAIRAAWSRSPTLANYHGGGPLVQQQADRIVGGVTDTWRELAWIRSRWPHALIGKGILHPEDAICAKNIGCDAIVVSNHGGRQLNGAVPAIEALPRVRQAVGSAFTVLADGGFLAGEDVAIAGALGASAVLVGRATLWGLAVSGAQGAYDVLRLLADELRVALALTNCRTFEELGKTQLPSAPSNMQGSVERLDAHT